MTIQGHGTIREHYEEALSSTHQDSISLGKSMLHWLDIIEKEFPNKNLWGLTSHYQLGLYELDNINSKLYAVIIAKENFFQIEEKLATADNEYKTHTLKTVNEAMAILKSILNS